MRDNGFLRRGVRGIGGILIAGGVLMMICGCAGGPKVAPPPVVLHVDLERYAGHWYEIARYPNRFEKGCVGVTADYSQRADGKIDVLNQCWKESFSGKRVRAKGVAKIVDKQSNAKLKVTFFWPFYGDYWVIQLDPNYRWAVVSDPGRKYLWVLSRTKTMDPAVFAGITTQLDQWGFDTGKLIQTEHTADVVY